MSQQWERSAERCLLCVLLRGTLKAWVEVPHWEVQCVLHPDRPMTGHHCSNNPSSWERPPGEGVHPARQSSQSYFADQDQRAADHRPPGLEPHSIFCLWQTTTSAITRPTCRGQLTSSKDWRQVWERAESTPGKQLHTQHQVQHQHLQRSEVKDA